MNVNKVIVVSLLMALSQSCMAANILVMLPLPLYSHFKAYQPMLEELASRSHNITLVSPFPLQNKQQNIHHLIVPELYNEITDPSMFELTEPSIFENLKTYWDFGLRAGEVALKQKEVKKIMLAPSDSFDLIMMETFFLLEPMIALHHKFRCPIVNLHPWTLTVPIAHFTGNPIMSSFIPSVYSLYSDDMTLLQRTRNFLINSLELAGLHLYYLPKQDATMRKYFSDVEGFEKLPYITELLSKTSLSLIDAHQSLDFNKPYLSNVVQIGGLTLYNKQSLTEELKNFMDNSKEGFIYFSLGSHLPSSMLPQTFKRNLFSALEKLKENVIMKWDNPNEIKHKNVMVEKWLPQLEILGHPKCKLFVTHGGLHAIMEATYYKVPLVGVPLVADQPANVHLMEHLGLGLKINVFNNTEESILGTINTVISDKKFKKMAIERSSMFKDNAIDTVKNAVHHIEYVIKHKVSAPGSLHRNCFEMLQLDVIVVLAVTGVLLITCVTAFILFCVFLIKPKKGKKSKIH